MWDHCDNAILILHLGDSYLHNDGNYDGDDDDEYGRDSGNYDRSKTIFL